MSLWERFDDIAKASDVETAKVSFTPIEEGEYEATLVEIKATESKSSGLPMLSATFKLNNGRRIFYNQVLQSLYSEEYTVKNIANAISFLERVTGDEIKFTGLIALEKVINGVEVNGRYMIKVYYNDKDLEKKNAHMYVKSSLEEKVIGTPDKDFTPVEESDDDLPF